MSNNFEIIDAKDAPQSSLEIEERKGAIVLKLFPKGAGMQYAILTPDQAKDVAAVLQTYSYHAKYGSDPKSNSIMAEQIRAKLQNRIPHIIRSLEQKDKSPMYIAKNIIDVILAEVL